MEVVSNVTAPAQKHATDAAVYTALFKFLLKPKIFSFKDSKLAVFRDEENGQNLTYKA